MTICQNIFVKTTGLNAECSLYLYSIAHFKSETFKTHSDLFRSLSTWKAKSPKKIKTSFDAKKFDHSKIWLGSVWKIEIKSEISFEVKKRVFLQQNCYVKIYFNLDWMTSKGVDRAKMRNWIGFNSIKKLWAVACYLRKENLQLISRIWPSLTWLWWFGFRLKSQDHLRLNRSHIQRSQR